MAFRRRRQRDQTTEALAVFAAGIEGRVQLQLDALAEMQATISELLVATHAESGRRESDLARALERVALVCEQSVQLIAADRSDREAFLELLAEIEAPVRRSLESPKPLTPRSSAVLGGSIVVPPADVDLVEAESADAEEHEPSDSAG
jgi:hypothetical protein